MSSQSLANHLSTCHDEKKEVLEESTYGRRNVEVHSSSDHPRNIRWLCGCAGRILTMKIPAAALLSLWLSCENAEALTSPTFVPRRFASTFVPPSATVGMSPASPRTRTSTRASASSMTMLVETSGGMEELQELTERADQKNPLNKRVRKSPSFFKLAGLASIPVSVALGFGIVPSRRLAAHAVGGIVTGIAGVVGKSKLDAITEGSAKPAIAQAIIDNGLGEDTATTAQAVKNVQEAFGILDEDFAALCSEIYATYMAGMVKYNPTAKTSELKELEQLKDVLALDNLAIGEAHAAAASEWYRNTCLFTPAEDLEDPDHPDRKAMDKLLFLTERALRANGETQEAFKFEMTRVAKAVQITLDEALERVAETAEPFYQRALKSTRSKLGSSQVSSAMLERARKTLGISDETTKDMHVACYNEEVRELLGIADANAEELDYGSIKFGPEAMERVRMTWICV